MSLSSIPLYIFCGEFISVKCHMDEQYNFKMPASEWYSYEMFLIFDLLELYCSNYYVLM